MIQYRFIDLDLSVTITLEQDDFLFVPGFKSTDAKSHLNIPRDLVSKLFYYSVQYVDISNNVESNNNYSKMKYAMDSSGWYNASYSNAIVDVSNQIISSSIYQNLKYDYIRFILKEITGNNTTSGLFRNTDKLLQTVVSMDPLFNSQITTIIDTCGTIYSPKLADTFYNNPSRVLIESILANDNVIETDNEERRTALINTLTTKATTAYNNSTSYYAVGTETGAQTQYCYFPIYLKTAAGRTAIQFTEYPDYTFYENNATQYTNIDSIFMTAYQVYDNGLAKYFYPVYLNNIDGTRTAITVGGITFYTNDPVGKAETSSNPVYTSYSTLLSTNTTAYYVKGTKVGDTVPHMYFPIYLIDTDPSTRLMVRFTDASYASYPLYTTFTNYTSVNSEIISNTNTYSIYASYLDSAVQFFDIKLNSSVGSTAIQFTDASYAGMTFYSTYSNYDVAYYIQDTIDGGSSVLYYYPIYLTNATGRKPIKFENVDPTITFYTTDLAGKGGASSNPVYPNYTSLSSSGSQYFIYGTVTTTSTQQYYIVYTNDTGGLTSIVFKEYPLRTFYYKKNLNHYANYASGTPAINTAYYVYGSISGSNGGAYGYYYPLYINNGSTHTTAVVFTNPSVTLYSTGTTTFIRRYDDLASSFNSPYYIYGLKTGTTTPYNYYPIYFNYPGHICSTPITFDNYPNQIFYTNYEEVNSQFEPFEFEYGDSMSVRITYKPKYNTYLGKEVNDYSYEVYLDMGLESNYKTPYKITGDENSANTTVAQITYVGTKIYTALGTSKVYHYVLQNTKIDLSDLYTSPYNFYPTLNDILNVSFDTLNPTAGTKWVFSIYCRPRALSSDVYDEIGFDRFDSENTVSIADEWVSYDITNLTWTNGTKTGLLWSSVLDLIIEPTTTPYGYIKTNGQQQIMVLAISTDSSSCTASIRNTTVLFKDGRTITMN